MNLSIFVIVPLLMLLGLWLARNDKQVRGVMVAGASVLLALSIYLVFAFLEARETMPYNPNRRDGCLLRSKHPRQRACRQSER
jgi:glucan phosphoethanolaminetransferase (alkaline phosphatase superfamily)